MSNPSQKMQGLSVNTNMTKNPPPSPPLTGASSETELTDADALTVSELITAMKTTLTKIGQSFESLSVQTSSVAELRPAIEASQELRKIHIRLQHQYDRQGERISQLKVLIEDGIKERVNKDLKPAVVKLIHDKVQDKLKERVEQELAKQIPNDMKQAIIRHKRQILHIKTDLHNSEARRSNSLGATYLSPLTALLRPSSALDVDNPTPSDHFPKTIQDLVSLSPTKLVLLARDYGLDTSTGNLPADVTADAHENLLDRVMAHIGVPYETVRGSNPLLVVKKRVE